MDLAAASTSISPTAPDRSPTPQKQPKSKVDVIMLGISSDQEYDDDPARGKQQKTIAKPQDRSSV